MYFISTRGGEKVTGAQAIVQGLAKNGGLFVPEKFPAITQAEIEAMAEMNYPERTAFVLGKYLADDLGADYLKEICEKAYSSFEGNDPVPLRRWTANRVCTFSNFFTVPLAPLRIWR